METIIKDVFMFILVCFAMYTGYCFHRHNKTETKKAIAAQERLLEETAYYETEENQKMHRVRM